MPKRALPDRQTSARGVALRRQGAAAQRTPLYRRIADDIAKDIQTGRFQVGDILPTELEWAESLAVSRGSVRQAMQVLSDWGMVDRARKTGTRVVGAEPVAGYSQRLGSLRDTLGFAGDTVMRLDDIRDVADPHERGLADLTSATGYWLQLTGTRHLPADGRICTWTRVFINGAQAGIRPHLRSEMASIYEVIEQVYGLRVSQLRQKMTAIGLPTYAAKALGLRPGLPVIEVQAWLYADSGALVEFVRSIHNPALYSMEFTAQSQDA